MKKTAFVLFVLSTACVKPSGGKTKSVEGVGSSQAEECVSEPGKQKVEVGFVTRKDPATGIETKVKQVALVGYGSLTNAKSIENSLGGAEFDGKLYPFVLSGWTRSWSAAMPNDYFYFQNQEGQKVVPENIIYLNAERKEGSSMNGFVFVVTEDLLPSFDSREWIYDREDVTKDFNNLTICGGKAYIYRAKPKFKMDTRNANDPTKMAVRGSYRKVVQDAIDVIEPESLKKDYATQYTETTQPFPESIVVTDIRDESKCNPIYNTRNGAFDQACKTRQEGLRDSP